METCRRDTRNREIANYVGKISVMHDVAIDARFLGSSLCRQQAQLL
jgi:hypothetical protein